MSPQEILEFFMAFCGRQRLEVSSQQLSRVAALVEDDPSFWQNASMWNLYYTTLEEQE